MKILFIIMTVFGLLGWFFYPITNKESKKLLFENKLWKVYYVVENNYPAGKDNFYVVYFQDKKLILPDNIGGAHKIERFTAANGFKIGDENSNSVIVVFAYHFVKNEGNLTYKTLMIYPKNTGSDELVFEKIEN